MTGRSEALRSWDRAAALFHERERLLSVGMIWSAHQLGWEVRLAGEHARGALVQATGRADLELPSQTARGHRD